MKQRKRSTGFMCLSDGYLSGIFPKRCRKCEGCLAREQWIWTARALVEIHQHPRTLRLDLTIRDGAIPKLDWKHAYPEFQKYLKRVRKQTNGSIRFLCVSEHGKTTGRFHLHCLLHGDHGLHFKKARSQWSLGFTSGVVVKGTQRGVDKYAPRKAARYVSKYVTKDDGRKRPSTSYGMPYRGVDLNDTKIPEFLTSVHTHFPKADLRGVRIDGTAVPRDRVRELFKVDADIRNQLRDAAIEQKRGAADLLRAMEGN